MEMGLDVIPEDFGDSVVLSELMEQGYEPSKEGLQFGPTEILEYAAWLGIDPDNEQDLLWIAEVALTAPLPEGWKPMRQKGSDDVYYFNFNTGQSIWEHPLDEHYKQVYQQEKLKRMKEKHLDLPKPSRLAPLSVKTGGKIGALPSMLAPVISTVGQPSPPQSPPSSSASSPRSKQNQQHWGSSNSEEYSKEVKNIYHWLPRESSQSQSKRMIRSSQQPPNALGIKANVPSVLVAKGNREDMLKAASEILNMQKQPVNDAVQLIQNNIDGSQGKEDDILGIKYGRHLQISSNSRSYRKSEPGSYLGSSQKVNVAEWSALTGGSIDLLDSIQSKNEKFKSTVGKLGEVRPFGKGKMPSLDGILDETRYISDSQEFERDNFSKQVKINDEVSVVDIIEKPLQQMQDKFGGGIGPKEDNSMAEVNQYKDMLVSRTSGDKQVVDMLQSMDIDDQLSMQASTDLDQATLHGVKNDSHSSTSSRSGGLLREGSMASSSSQNSKIQEECYPDQGLDDSRNDAQCLSLGQQQYMDGQPSMNSKVQYFEQDEVQSKQFSSQRNPLEDDSDKTQLKPESSQTQSGGDYHEINFDPGSGSDFQQSDSISTDRYKSNDIKFSEIIKPIQQKWFGESTQLFGEQQEQFHNQDQDYEQGSPKAQETQGIESLNMCQMHGVLPTILEEKSQEALLQQLNNGYKRQYSHQETIDVDQGDGGNVVQQSSSSSEGQNHHHHRKGSPSILILEPDGNKSISSSSSLKSSEHLDGQNEYSDEFGDCIEIQTNNQYTQPLQKSKKDMEFHHSDRYASGSVLPQQIVNNSQQFVENSSSAAEGASPTQLTKYAASSMVSMYHQSTQKLSDQSKASTCVGTLKGQGQLESINGSFSTANLTNAANEPNKLYSIPNTSQNPSNIGQETDCEYDQDCSQDVLNVQYTHQQVHTIMPHLASSKPFNTAKDQSLANQIAQSPACTEIVQSQNNSGSLDRNLGTIQCAQENETIYGNSIRQGELSETSLGLLNDMQRIKQTRSTRLSQSTSQEQSVGVLGGMIRGFAGPIVKQTVQKLMGQNGSSGSMKIKEVPKKYVINSDQDEQPINHASNELKKIFEEFSMSLNSQLKETIFTSLGQSMTELQQLTRQIASKNTQQQPSTSETAAINSKHQLQHNPTTQQHSNHKSPDCTPQHSTPQHSTAQVLTNSTPPTLTQHASPVPICTNMLSNPYQPPWPAYYPYVFSVPSAPQVHLQSTCGQHPCSSNFIPSPSTCTQQPNTQHCLAPCLSAQNQQHPNSTSASQHVHQNQQASSISNARQAPNSQQVFAGSSASAIKYSGQVVDTSQQGIDIGGRAILCQGSGIKETTTTNGQITNDIGESSLKPRKQSQDQIKFRQRSFVDKAHILSNISVQPRLDEYNIKLMDHSEDFEDRNVHALEMLEQELQMSKLRQGVDVQQQLQYIQDALSQLNDMNGLQNQNLNQKAAYLSASLSKTTSQLYNRLGQKRRYYFQRQFDPSLSTLQTQSVKAKFQLYSQLEKQVYSLQIKSVKLLKALSCVQDRADDLPLPNKLAQDSANTDPLDIPFDAPNASIALRDSKSIDEMNAENWIQESRRMVTPSKMYANIYPQNGTRAPNSLVHLHGVPILQDFHKLTQQHMPLSHARLAPKQLGHTSANLSDVYLRNIEQQNRCLEGQSRWFENYRRLAARMKISGKSHRRVWQ